MNIGALSYSIGAVCYGALFLLLLTNWRGRLKGAVLVTTVFVTVIWAMAAAYYAANAFGQGGLFYQILEVIRPVAWIVFLLQLLQPLISTQRNLHRTFRFLYPGLFVLTGLLLSAVLFPQGFGSVRLGIDIAIFGHVCLAIAGLVLLEQLFRNTRPRERWATKYLYLGIGALFAYDLFLYSDALLFKRIDQQIWYARGLINAMVVPLIAVSAARNPQWSLDVFVSRRMALYSASILGAGLYLLLMAGVGYYIRLYGGSWGTTVQLIFLAGAGLLLLTLLFSGQAQASLKVFLSKHFYNYKYDYREEWLKFINTLSLTGTDESLRERAIRAIAEIVHSTGGLLWTRGEKNDFFLVTAWNMGEQTVHREPGDSSLVDFLERRRWVIELDAIESQRDIYQNLVLPPWLQRNRRAWLIVPLLHGDNLKGFVVLARPRAAQQLNWEDWDLLKTAGRQVASYVSLLDTTEALMDARQFEAFNRLSAYVVHDLKNVTAQLSLIVSNGARHKNNPAFVDDAIQTVANATTKMNRMLTQLRKGGVPSGEPESLALETILEEVVAACSKRPPTPRLTEIVPPLRIRANRERLVTVLGHMIQNAQEATVATGRVEIKAYRADTRAIIEITDDGCGMDERFIRERLFRPFDTTKGNAGMGIGVYESREYIHSLGGDIDVASRPGTGTTFILRLPLIGREETSIEQDEQAKLKVAM